MDELVKQILTYSAFTCLGVTLTLRFIFAVAARNSQDNSERILGGFMTIIGLIATGFLFYLAILA
jgi:hypothetical protein